MPSRNPWRGASTRAFGVRTFSVCPPGVALRFTPGYTPVALRAAKTKLIHPVLARMGVGYAPGVARFAQPLV